MHSKSVFFGMAFIVAHIALSPSAFCKDVLERQLVHEERDENIRNTIDGKYIPQGKIFEDLRRGGSSNDVPGHTSYQEDADGFPVPLEK